MDTPNSPKRSPRSSATPNRKHVRIGGDDRAREDDTDHEQYLDRSFDHVARVRVARAAAQRRMEEFGDLSEYDITIIQGQLKRDLNHDQDATQPSLDFEDKGE